MDCKITILIPTLPQREHLFEKLKVELSRQCEESGRWKDILIAWDLNAEESIGAKRQRMMMEKVDTPYMCFFDDDDLPGPNYIRHIMEGIDKGVDVCSLHGIITTDGRYPKHFYHSIKYDRFFEENNIYYRCPNHLNVMKTELAKQCVFPDWQRSEDSNFAFQLQAKGLLKTEHYIDEVIYHYLYVQDKKY